MPTLYQQYRIQGQLHLITATTSTATRSPSALSYDPSPSSSPSSSPYHYRDAAYWQAERARLWHRLSPDMQRSFYPEEGGGDGGGGGGGGKTTTTTTTATATTVTPSPTTATSRPPPPSPSQTPPPLFAMLALQPLAVDRLHLTRPRPDQCRWVRQQWSGTGRGQGDAVSKDDPCPSPHWKIVRDTTADQRPQ